MYIYICIIQLGVDNILSSYDIIWTINSLNKHITNLGMWLNINQLQPSYITVLRAKSTLCLKYSTHKMGGQPSKISLCMCIFKTHDILSSFIIIYYYLNILPMTEHNVGVSWALNQYRIHYPFRVLTLTVVGPC